MPQFTSTLARSSPPPPPSITSLPHPIPTYASTSTPTASPSRLPPSSTSSATTTRKHLSGIKLASRSGPVGNSLPSSSSTSTSIMTGAGGAVVGSRVGDLISGPLMAFSPRRNADSEKRKGKGKDIEREQEGDESGGVILDGNGIRNTDYIDESMNQFDAGTGQSAGGEGWEKYDPAFRGLDEDEVFRIVTRPKEMKDGRLGWGIPRLTEEKCDPVLEVSEGKLSLLPTRHPSEFCSADSGMTKSASRLPRLITIESSSLTNRQKSRIS